MIVQEQSSFYKALISKSEISNTVAKQKDIQLWSQISLCKVLNQHTLLKFCTFYIYMHMVFVHLSPCSHHPSWTQNNSITPEISPCSFLIKPPPSHYPDVSSQNSIACVFILYKRNHTVCILFSCFFSTQYNVFRIYICCYLYQ